MSETADRRIVYVDVKPHFDEPEADGYDGGYDISLEFEAHLRGTMFVAATRNSVQKVVGDKNTVFVRRKNEGGGVTPVSKTLGRLIDVSKVELIDERMYPCSPERMFLT